MVLPVGPEAVLAVAPGVSRETLDRLTLYAELLEKWQKTVNLVGPKTLPEVWQRHMADSAQLLPLVPANAQRLADFGSGAGFPGLVLAIMTGIETVLVESDVRKSAFLREVARQTGTKATVQNVRIEAARSIGADVISARALAPLEDLLKYARLHLNPGGVGLFPKGESWQDEIAVAAKHHRFTHSVQPSRTAPGAVILTVKDIEHE
ncbi:16S rRNA (guanine(527)-N(7))-methyltransferase RsmG [Lacibacterium aquatile]|uniref:Ribosomal RNA small subunit methyltransferase G n=1 Tax=Lacibacterium aquatile TaxID=1168082 RepID=A0ABW5DWU3_9PROT